MFNTSTNLTLSLADLYDKQLMEEWQRRDISAPYRANPCQAEILADEHRYIICALPRKFGKTALACHWILEQTKRGMVSCYVSTTFDTQSVVTVPEMLSQCPDAIYYNSRQRILLPWGGTIILTYADDPRAARRQRGRSKIHAWVFDEAAFYASDYLSTTWADVGSGGARALMVSTKWPGSEFERIVLDVAPSNTDDYVVYDKWSFMDGRPGYQSEQDRLEQMKRYEAMMPRSVFEREIMNLWGDREGAVFCGTDHAWSRGASLPELPANDMPLGIGIDLGRSVDYTAVVACDIYGNLYPLLHIRGEGWYNQVQRIGAIMKEYPNALPAWVDATGLGDPVYEMLTAQGIKCYPVQMGSLPYEGAPGNWKEQLVLQMSLRMERGQLQIAHSRGGEELLRELRCFMYTSGSVPGRYRYGASSDAHDDLVCAAMLASAASERLPRVLATTKQTGLVAHGRDRTEALSDKPRRRKEYKRALG